jgi:hypothetical protein
MMAQFAVPRGIEEEESLMCEVCGIIYGAIFI